MRVLHGLGQEIVSGPNIKKPTFKIRLWMNVGDRVGMDGGAIAKSRGGLLAVRAGAGFSALTRYELTTPPCCVVTPMVQSPSNTTPSAMIKRGVVILP